MKLRPYLLLLAGLLQSCVMFASGLGVDGPISGYYTDPRTGAVYPVSGVPGAATLGQPLALNFQFVSIAPDGHTALALENGSLVLVPNIAQPANLTPLTTWADPIDKAVWASDASGVVIYSSVRGAIRTVTGINGTPVLNPQIPVSGEISGLRLSRAPWSVAFDVTRLEHRGQRAANVRVTSIFLSLNSNPPFEVPGILSPGPMDFSADARTLYVVDQENTSLLAVAVGAATSAAPVPVSISFQGSAAVVALSVSFDGQYLYAAQGSSRNVCAYEIASGNSLFCAAPDVPPAVLQQLAPSLYLLNTPTETDTPLWLFDASQKNVFFVPRGGQTQG